MAKSERDTKKFVYFDFKNPNRVIMGGTDSDGEPWKLRETPLGVGADQKHSDHTTKRKFNRVSINGQTRQFRTSTENGLLIQRLRDLPFVTSSKKSKGLTQPNISEVVEWEPEIQQKQAQANVKLMREVDAIANRITDDLLNDFADYYKLPMTETADERVERAFMKLSQLKNASITPPQKALDELNAIFKVTPKSIELTEAAGLKIALWRAMGTQAIARNRESIYMLNNRYKLGRTEQECLEVISKSDEIKEALFASLETKVKK